MSLFTMMKQAMNDGNDPNTHSIKQDFMANQQNIANVSLLAAQILGPDAAAVKSASQGQPLAPAAPRVTPTSVQAPLFGRKKTESEFGATSKPKGPSNRG